MIAPMMMIMPTNLQLEPTMNLHLKEKKASDKKIKSCGDEPDYMKKEKQEPHDSRITFEMKSDWQPTDSIKPLLLRACMIPDVSKLDQSRISDFVNYWFGKPEKKTADGWNGA